MPNFIESLQGRDLGHLRILAQLWGISLDDQDIPTAIQTLKNGIIDRMAVETKIFSLAGEAKAALDDLAKHSGRLPWAQFSRQHGEVREMGAARRDRELPYETPVSDAEVLWYLGLVARAFFDSPAGPEEFAYIPDDLLALFPPETIADLELLGRPASSAEYAQIYPANDRILDHTCTTLAGLRMGINLPDALPTPTGEVLTKEFLHAMLLSCGLVDEAGNPSSEPVRKFLGARRGDAFVRMYAAWRDSEQINELRLLPDLVTEGKWENDPLRTRGTIAGFLSKVSEGTWWNLLSFVSAIKQHNPDFQRPAGDYDSWFVKQQSTGEYLRGFQHWDEVDGRLVHYLVCGPFYWLGVVDLACPAEGQGVTAFRLSGWSKALLDGAAPKGLAAENEPLVARSDAHISARRLTPRRVRYQIARFCEWERETPDEYLYRITPSSLAGAQRQGLKVSQLISMLEQHTKAIPPSLLKALERWDQHGSEARLEQMVVLRVTSEEILQAMRKSRAGRFLGEPLGPGSVAIKAGAVDKVLAALAELGWLGEIRGDLE